MNEIEFQLRIDVKACHRKKHDCEKKLVYHCLLSTNLTHFVEDCAPDKLISEFCAEFNVKGAVVQRQRSASCRNLSKPCLKPYHSSNMSLEFPDCYTYQREAEGEIYATGIPSIDSSVEKNTIENSLSTAVSLDPIYQDIEEGNHHFSKFLTIMGSVYITVVIMAITGIEVRNRYPNAFDDTYF
ncbi:uncharacterized protein LOC134272590 [Saccostrea cucullata]|uniref:uncharacterized protein LOC134272590 n=1 Tax=Saccostrea cuccullata TaxID=36930 RepID=UPI002ED48689